MKFTITLLAENFINEEYGYFDADKDGVYRPKLNYFISYLLDELSIANDDISKLKDLDSDVIFKGMRFYINESRKLKSPKDHVNKMTTILSYFTVIKRFFKYIHKEGVTNNKIIEQIARWDLDPNNAIDCINGVASEFRIEKKQYIKQYSNVEIDKLLLEFRSIFYLLRNEPLRVDLKESFKEFTAGLIVIFIFETGLKTERIKDIKIRHLNLLEKTIEVRNVKLAISNELSEALDFYLKLRSNVESDSVVFMDLFNNEAVYNTAYLQRFISKVGKNDVTGIIRYRIKQYVDVGIPIFIISHVTGNGKDFMENVLIEHDSLNYEHVNKYFKSTSSNFELTPLT